MKTKYLIFVLIAIIGFAGPAKAKPFTVIIVTNNDMSEEGYTEFLEDIYRGNVDVQIPSDRYKEDLSETKKAENNPAHLFHNSLPIK